MGLAVLESLFYALSLWCFEFLHLKCREFVKLVWRDTVFLGDWWWSCDFVNRFVKYWEGFWEWFFVWYIYMLLCQAVNEQWLTLDFVRIFMLMYQVGSVIGDLCGCLCVCAVVCLCKILDGILMFSHMMVVIGDRRAWLPDLSGLCVWIEYYRPGKCTQSPYTRIWVIYYVS